MKKSFTRLGAAMAFVGGLVSIAEAQDGANDPTFNPTDIGANSTVLSTALQADGKIIIGGAFTSYNGTGRNSIARLNADGSLDSNFNPGTGANALINSVSIQADGKIIIGGNFTSYNGTSINHIARLNNDGSLDIGFNPGTGASDWVYTTSVQTDGKILIGGNFTSYNGNGTVSIRIARLNADGSLDMGFSAGANGIVRSNACQADGKTLIGGHFLNYNGVTVRDRIARLNSNGSMDNGFNPATDGPNNAVHSISIQADGKILIGGWFTTCGGMNRNYIARLNTDGSLDTGFNPGTGASSVVHTTTIQPDGKIIIGGLFTSYNGTVCNRIARLNADGSLDAGFNPGSGANNGVYAIAIQADGKIIIGGDFTSYNGTGRNRIARINGTPRASIKLILEGPYSAGTMSDALRTLPSFPLTEPFTAMGYANAAYTPGASIGATVLSTTGNNAIVDWVIVEMRPASAPATISASRAVLLQRDGDVVDLDGVSTAGFAGLVAGNYCVAVRSRNHLPVMLSATTPVSYGAAPVTVDFTLTTTQVHSANARKNVGGVMVLAAGDATFNQTVSYTGAGNDRDPILVRVGSTTPNNTVSGYYREDVNMDGVVKYTGANNDRDPILINVGSTTPNNTRGAALP